MKIIHGNLPYFKIFPFVLVATFMAPSCKKFIEVPPPTSQITNTTVFSDDGSATAAMLGIYSNLMNSSGFASGGPNSVSVLAGLSADELANFSNISSQVEFYSNSLTPANNTVYGFFWGNPYQFIYAANSVLEGLSAESQVTPALKKQLMGESLFLRAFCHFYLANFFGNIPLVTTTSYQANNVLTRSDTGIVYDQITSDLLQAQALLGSDYVDPGNNPTTERTRPNTWVASAMLARVYLFRQKWDSAEAEASLVINNALLYNLLPSLNDVFLKNSAEAIWQLQPVNPNINTNEGNIFILTSGPNNYNSVYMSPQLLASFEPGDSRFSTWIGVDSSTGVKYFYPFKYKVSSGSTLTEYSMVIRLAEMFLVRSEARVRQNDISGAQADLNLIRGRAGLPVTTASSQQDIIRAILHERQVELFTEWGHRWLDLRRTGTIDTVMSMVTQQKGGIWNTHQQLYPIPGMEIQNNSNLGQNPGY